MNDVCIEIRDGTGWVTINRPEVMNALSGAVLEGLLNAANTLGCDHAIRAVVVTAAGDRAFSAGADLKERREMTEAEARARTDVFGRTFTAWASIPKPTIALMNGLALGGGLELALTCDFRIARAQIQLGLPEVRLAILPGAGGTQRLPRLIGIARAKEMIMLGRRISAEDALAMGLVNRVVARDQLEPAARELVAELGACGPIGVVKAKEAIDRGFDESLERGLAIERSCYEVTLPTEDRSEALRAFAEKRLPHYQGR